MRKRFRGYWRNYTVTMEMACRVCKAQLRGPNGEGHPFPRMLNGKRHYGIDRYWKSRMQGRIWQHYKAEHPEQFAIMAS